MSSASITPLLGVTDPAAVQRSFQLGAKRPPAQAAAEQFEAILVRQLLGEALKPMFAGETKAPGADVYQYMVTDVVAQSVAQGGGLGIAKMIVPQLTPRGAVTDQPENFQ